MLISTYDGLTREEMATLRAGPNAGQIAIQTAEAAAAAASTVQHVGPDPAIERNDPAAAATVGGGAGALIAAGAAAFFMFR